MYEVVSKIFGTTLIRGNMFNVGSEEVAEHQGNASNIDKFKYLKAVKIIH